MARADRRGGYQKPRKPAPVSGPGKFSRRTDGQIKASPGLDHPEMQYGDVQRTQQAQAIQPLPIRPAPAGAPPAPASPAGAAGGVSSRRGDASWILGTPSRREGEPVTAGLDNGPGPGREALSPLPPDPEDIREVVLSFFASSQSGYNNQEAKAMLEEIQTAKAQRRAPLGGLGEDGPPAPGPITVDGGLPTAPVAPDEEDEDDIFGTEGGEDFGAPAAPSPSPIRSTPPPDEEADVTIARPDEEGQESAP